MTETEIDALEESLKKATGSKVERIETHGSWLLLTPELTYKLKKPVDLGFMDFSTFEKRQHYCEEELRLNRRLAKDIYLAVVPVLKDQKGRVFFGEEGTEEVIGHAVKMRRLDLDKQMDRALRSGEVREDHVLKLARQVAAFHQEAEVVSTEPAPQALKDRFNDLRTVRATLEKWVGTEAAEVVDQAIMISDEHIDAHLDLFQRRGREGMIRDCHGDLHSGNIFLYEDPIIFDCIEFNPDFRRIDVLNEIAFFCMDLEAYGRKDLSALFVKTYLKHLEAVKSEAELGLLTYFKCYRANVRLKVNAIRLEQSPDGEEREQVTDAVRLYLDLVKGYLGQLASTSFQH